MNQLQSMARVTALSAVMVFAQHAAGQDAADVVTARELFREGAQLAREGRWGEARDRYERSLKLKRAALTLYSLGVAQKNEGHIVEALESFRAFLAEPPVPGTELYHDPARDAVAELEKQVAGIFVKVNPPGIAGLRVDVDGVEVTASALDRPHLVNPGTHKVVVSAPRYRASEGTLTLAEGKYTTVDLALEPIPAQKTPMSAERAGGVLSPVPLLAAPAEQSHRTASLVCLGGGAALSAAGLVVGLAGLKAASEAPAKDSPQADRARAMALAGDVMGGIGIGVASAGLILLFIKTGTKKPSSLPLSSFSEENTAGIRVRF